MNKGEFIDRLSDSADLTKKDRASSRINPQTKKPIQVAAKVVPLFKPGKELKHVVEKNLKVTAKGGVARK